MSDWLELLKQAGWHPILQQPPIVTVRLNPSTMTWDRLEPRDEACCGDPGDCDDPCDDVREAFAGTLMDGLDDR